MPLKRILGSLIFIHLLGCSIYIAAQETSIDLRKDGRIISGSRKDFLMQRIYSYTYSLISNTPPSKLGIKVSERLRNKLVNSRIAAIVVPEGKIEDKFIIGLLIDNETLPEDCLVDEADFRMMRGLSTNKRVSILEKKFDEIRGEPPDRTGKYAAAKIGDLKAEIEGTGEEKESLEFYAGYLLAKLEGTPAMPKIDVLVSQYREEFERTADPVVIASIQQRELAWLEPVEVSGTTEYLTTNDLNDAATIEVRKSTGSSYIKVWHRRSLVIIPEKPDVPFNFTKHKTLTGYLEFANADTALNSPIRRLPGKDVFATNERISAIDDYVIEDAAAVYFNVDSAVISPEYKHALDELAAKAMARKGYVIEITGHADSTGNVGRNRALSQQRADAVVRYLQERHNIPLRRIITPFGYGQMRPAADNITLDGRKQNRRVEVKILVSKDIRN